MRGSAKCDLRRPFRPYPGPSRGGDMLEFEHVTSSSHGAYWRHAGLMTSLRHYRQVQMLLSYLAFWRQGRSSWNQSWMSLGPGVFECRSLQYFCTEAKGF